jgi:hypothetical protein
MDPTNQAPMSDPALTSAPAPVLDGLPAPDQARAGSDKRVLRETPEVAEARRRLCKAWQSRLEKAKKHWQPKFDKMREDQRFAAGEQWPDDKDGELYVANVTLRHVHQRVASVYAKNPRVVVRRRKRLMSQLWDESMSSLQSAMQQIAMAMQSGVTDPAALAPAAQIVEEAQAMQEQNRLNDRIAKTLQLAYEYNVSEQAHPFKAMMKLTVRRAVTTGVGYVKLGFQRAMKMRPDVEARISDLSERLALIERIADDLADGEIQKDSGESEQLRLALQALQDEPMLLVREGLVFDFPDSTSIIPDPKCRQLRNFLGCDWVAQEFYLSPEQVQEIYKIDVRKGARAFNMESVAGGAKDAGQQAVAMMSENRGVDREGDSFPDSAFVEVHEIYSRKDGMVYVTCTGFPDFLQEPASPDVYTDRFWPWFPLVLNEVYSDQHVFPPSDVRLLMPMQREINRSRQALADHRIAAAPKVASSAGALSDADKGKLSAPPKRGVTHLELAGLQPGQKVADLIQKIDMPNIDPNLYETRGSIEDVLRTVGTQEANLGGTSGSTATESSIAEGSRMSALSSSADELDDLLTQLARAGGQIILANFQKPTIEQIVGPGAAWPDTIRTREEVSKEIWLEIEAGSSGRPNQAQEIQNAAQLFPLLMQIPGINPEFLGKDLLRRYDDRLDLTDAFSIGAPSIQMLNRMAGGAGQASGKGPDSNPNAQGDKGGDNAPSTERPTGGMGGRAPEPNQVAGAPVRGSAQASGMASQGFNP